MSRKYIVFQDSGNYSSGNSFDSSIRYRDLFINRFRKQADGTFYGCSREKVTIRFMYTTDLGYFDPRIVDTSLSHNSYINKDVLNILNKVAKAFEKIGTSDPDLLLVELKAIKVEIDPEDSWVWHSVPR